jgi:hypothetical protein
MEHEILLMARAAAGVDPQEEDEAIVTGIRSF